MREVTVNGRIRTRPEHVYDFLVDNRNDPLWCPMVSEVELLEGQPGLGALYRYQQAQGPMRRPLTAFMRTVTAERPRRLAWDGDDRGLPYRSTIELRGDRDRTVVSHTNRVTLPDTPQQLVWWSIANVVLRLQLRNLRRELER